MAANAMNSRLRSSTICCIKSILAALSAAGFSGLAVLGGLLGLANPDLRRALRDRTGFIIFQYLNRDWKFSQWIFALHIR
jgi:hypothetical protein